MMSLWWLVEVPYQFFAQNFGLNTKGDEIDIFTRGEIITEIDAN